MLAKEALMEERVNEGQGGAEATYVIPSLACFSQGLYSIFLK